MVSRMAKQFKVVQKCFFHGNVGLGRREEDSSKDERGALEGVAQWSEKERKLKTLDFSLTHKRNK